MDTHTTNATQARPSQGVTQRAAATVSPGGSNPSPVVTVSCTPKVEDDELRQGPPRFNGQELHELSLTFAPSPIGPPFFVTADGSVEIGRIFYSGGKYIIGKEGDRAGSTGSRAIGCSVSSTDGLQLLFSTGHILFVDIGALQGRSLTYKVKGP